MGKLRDQMPIIDAFVDDLRATFGREAIDRAIVEGLQDGTFHARENGHELGRPVVDPGITLDRITRDDGSMYVIHVKRRKGNGNGAQQTSEE